MDYLHLFALLCLAFGWAQLAKAAIARRREGAKDPFFENKLTTGKFFLARILPDGKANLAKLKTGAESLMALPAEAF